MRLIVLFLRKMCPNMQKKRASWTFTAIAGHWLEAGWPT